MNFEASRKKVAALVAPRNVVIVGASDRPGNWALRAWNNLKRYEFPGKIYLINPRRDEILGERCYPDFASLPEPPDHLLVVVPAASVSEAIAAGAAAGARSATVFSSGFGEAFDEAGAALGKQLRETIARAGIGVSGPNCMGNVCKPARFVTLIDALYEHRVKLFAAADATPEELYEAGDGRFEFERTVSRLTEMQSADYMALGHGED